MLCRDCMNIGICKHYDYLCQHPHLSIDRCGYYNPIAIKREKEEPIQEEHIEKFIPKIVPLNNNVKEYPDLRGEPNTCPNCEGKTYADIISCAHCNRQMCEDCAYVDDVDVVSGDVTYLCEECYSYAHANDEEEVMADESSLFEMITSELIVEGDDN